MHCHSDWKLASGKIKLPDARQKLTELRKSPHASRGMVQSWWKSLLCSCPKSVIFLFVLCPSSLLRKSSTLCCILFVVVCTCGFGEFILLDALDKDWDKTRQLKNAIWMGDSVFLACRHFIVLLKSTPTRLVWRPANKAYVLFFALNSSMYSSFDAKINK